MRERSLAFFVVLAGETAVDHFVAGCEVARTFVFGVFDQRTVDTGVAIAQSQCCTRALTRHPVSERFGITYQRRYGIDGWRRATRGAVLPVLQYSITLLRLHTP